MSEFYSYLWLRADASPYYAGKGTRDRAFTNCGHGIHRPKERSRILLFAHATESEAFESEKNFIKWFGRKDIGTGVLRNLTEGGEGMSNPSAETRRRMSEAHKGQRHRLGCKHSAETKQKMAASQMRRNLVPVSNETRLKISTSLLGNTRRRGVVDSEETTHRKSEAAKRRGISPEMQKRMKRNLGRSSNGRFFKLCLSEI
jgi:hypothetical protein